MELKDRVALVTGASEGIGRAIALELAAAGAHVAICARNRDRLKAVVQEIRDMGARAFQKPCDLTDEAQIRAFVQAAELELGPADILVNNAGVGYHASFEDLTVNRLDEMLAVNVRGAYLTTQSVVPGMKERRRGHIINIASLAGRNGVAQAAGYAATKHALLGLSHSLMLELRPFGIHVTAVCPGSVHTRFFEKADMPIGNLEAALTPDAVARSVRGVLELPAGALVSDLDIRPMVPPTR